jgi:hypothetical protein
MMCRFLSADFELSIKCPVDRLDHAVKFQAYPHLRGHALDAVTCDAMPCEQLTCGKACRALLESGEYWQKIYPESVVYAQSPQGQ